MPHAFRMGDNGVLISLGVSIEEAQRLTLGNLWAGVRIVPWWKILKHDIFIWNIIQVLRALCYQKQLPHPRELGGYAQSLASHILAIEREKKATTYEGLTPLQLRRVDIYIEEHFRDRLTVKDIAMAAGFKKDHFAHLFKTSTGFSPHRYVIALRLEYVRRLKNRGTMTNAQIAAEAGFYDESHLSRCIKHYCRGELENYHGILPSMADSSNTDAE
ncbi:AraC family transcriptional regulator [Termitidicoccus mucosus]